MAVGSGMGEAISGKQKPNAVIIIGIFWSYWFDEKFYIIMAHWADVMSSKLLLIFHIRTYFKRSIVSHFILSSFLSLFAHSIDSIQRSIEPNPIPKKKSLRKSILNKFPQTNCTFFAKFPSIEFSPLNKVIAPVIKIFESMKIDRSFVVRFSNSNLFDVLIETMSNMNVSYFFLQLHFPLQEKYYMWS